jgi:ABC-type uncharacterized transport system permease subunit
MYLHEIAAKISFLVVEYYSFHFYLLSVLGLGKLKLIKFSQEYRKMLTYIIPNAYNMKNILYDNYN